MRGWGERREERSVLTCGKFVVNDFSAAHVSGRVVTRVSARSHVVPRRTKYRSLAAYWTRIGSLLMNQ